MMSATLPEKIKELIESFQKGISKEALRLSLTKHTLILIPLEFRLHRLDEAPDQLKKKFKVQWLHELEDVIDFLVENASEGVFMDETLCRRQE